MAAAADADLITPVDADGGVHRWRCNRCQKRFERRQSARQHAELHLRTDRPDVGRWPKRPKPTPIPADDGKRQPTTAATNTDEDDAGRLDCRFCKSVFTTPYNRQRHETRRHLPNPPKFVCDLCKRSYRSRQSRLKHLVVRHGFSAADVGSNAGGGVCRHGGCGRVFSRPALLAEHEAGCQMLAEHGAVAVVKAPSDDEPSLSPRSQAAADAAESAAAGTMLRVGDRVVGRVLL
jgi:hypothetical protein